MKLLKLRLPGIRFNYGKSNEADRISSEVSQNVSTSKSHKEVECCEDYIDIEEHKAKMEALIAKTRAEAFEEAKMYFDAEKKEWTKEKPKDWAFMVQSGETLKNLPPTWMQYPNTQEGMVKIIEMEYGEVMAAWKDKMGDKAVSHELVHLASACLHLWRRLNHAE